MGDKCGRQVGDKWETSVKSCGPEHPDWETSVGDKQETHVKACGPERPEWEASVGDKWEKCKIMLPRASRVGDKRQAGDTCKHAAQSTQMGRQAWETSGRQV